MITKKYYKTIDETLYHECLDNGLTVYYLPKKGWNKNYAIFTSQFGSLDRTFNGKKYPEGIAHFLEHKLFEKKEGDVMLEFGKLGAQTNAFTSFDRTSYLFTSSEKLEENLTLLLDFVQEAYFTEASIQKEQGIIAQEIQMYQDDPDWQLFSGLLAALYPNSALAEDIAGTVESISEINSEMLYENFKSFYQPSNMSLFLTGDFNLEEISKLIVQNQSEKVFEKIEIKREERIFQAAIPKTEKKAEIVESKLALGFRGNNHPQKADFFEYKIAMEIFFSLIFGKTSQFYEESYQKSLIDDSFSYDFEFSEDFQCLILTLDTKNPEKLTQLLQEQLKSYKMKGDVTNSHFDLLRRKLLGLHISSLNSLEYIAQEFTSTLVDESKNIFDLSTILSELTLEKLERFAGEFLETSEQSVFIMRPE
ncbi:MAG: EF-P 5-aminopentanol modification-associated protein YfmH [Lactovum sp.]